MTSKARRVFESPVFALSWTLYHVIDETSPLYQITAEDLAELKKIIAGFLLDRARDKADAIWDEKGYSDEKLKKLLLNE